MKRIFKYRLILVLALFIGRPICGLGNQKRSCCRFQLTVVNTATVLNDTIPQPKKSESPKKEKEVADQAKVDKTKTVIKVVPRARKQLKPVALPKAVPVKPIKVIKPKIIKRITGLIP